MSADVMLVPIGFIIDAYKGTARKPWITFSPAM